MKRFPGHRAQLVILTTGFLLLCGRAALAQSTQPSDTAVPRVTLLDAGAAPHRTLRYKPAVGDSHTLTMMMRMSMTQKMGEMSTPPQNMPAIKCVIDTRVIEVNDEEITYDFELTQAQVLDEPGTPPKLATMLRSTMQDLVGVEGEGRMNQRGFTQRVNYKARGRPNSLAKQQLEGIRKSLSQMCIPLPEEAVGVGARWRVVSTVMQNDITIEQTSDITLKEFEGDNVHLVLDLEQTAEPQEVKELGLPGTSAHLKSLHSKGSAAIVARFDQVVPVTINNEATSDSAMALMVGNTPQEVEQHIEMTMEMKGEPAVSPAPTTRSNP